MLVVLLQSIPGKFMIHLHVEIRTSTTIDRVEDEEILETNIDIDGTSNLARDTPSRVEGNINRLSFASVVAMAAFA